MPAYIWTRRVLRLRAGEYCLPDQGDQGIVRSEDGEIAGGFVDDEEHGGLGDGFWQVERMALARRDVDGLADAAIEDVHGKDAAAARSATYISERLP